MSALLLTLAAIACACTAPDRTRQVLEQDGYRDIEIKGWAPFACSDGDDFTTSFTATNPQGVRVSGAVCCGLLKACTIRRVP